ncbi:MAG TPA: hypothetical protein VF210_02290 [Pseudomonadales bacterium]
MSDHTTDTIDKRVEAGVFLACLLVVGVPFWRLPYSSVNVPDAFYGPGLWVLAAAPLLLARFARSGFVRSFVIAALVPGAALMLRVIVEGIQDPTSHNLWPLALIIVLVLGAVVAAPGAVLGWLLARVLR